MSDPIRGCARALPWLRLVRVGTLFSPAADVIAGACLVGTPWSVDLARGAGASVLVYAAGMVLNDHADRREDAEQRPDRPIPAGQIRPVAALGAGLGLLAGGIAVSPWPVWWALLAGLVLFYDYLPDRLRLGVGAPTMATLRALNLLGGAAWAARSVPTDGAVLIPAVAYAIYVLSITVLGHFEDARRVSPRAVLGVQSVPPIVAVLALLALPSPGPAVWVGLTLAALFFARTRRIQRAWDRAAIRGAMTWLLLGTMLYTSLLCLGSGRILEAASIAAAVVPARWISRRIALT